MQGDDPPFLPVGTDVSAKYKGAFCEAKIKKVVRNIKCKVTLKAGGSLTVNDDIIKGTLRVGSTVEVKQDPKKEAIEAVISKIQDCSQYTVVFDDGDITTLRRSALCLKSGRHFNESETLDQLPLTHPEHFSTPVIAGRRGRRGRAQSDESDGEAPVRPAVDSKEREPHVGRVVLVESSGSTERRRPQQPAFPALVVAPTAQIKVKEDYLVRSFKDGRYYTVPKKEAREFRKGGAPIEWAGVDAALQYLNNGVLPPHWDRDALFNEPPNSSDDSSDDEPREEKDHFVAQLYKFMDDRGTPLNRNPTIANRDIDLYRLFRVVHKQGGYNRVTNQNQWKSIARKMGFHPVTTSITNLCKQFYKKFLYSFEDFYRKLGVTLVAHPRGTRTPPSGRSLIRDRDKQLLNTSPAPTASTTPLSSQRKDREKDSDKSETEKSEKDDKEVKIEKDTEKTRTEKVKALDKARASDGDDSADNQPLVGPSKTIEKDNEKDHKEKEKVQKELEKQLKEKENKDKENKDKERERVLKEKLKEEKEKEKLQKDIEKQQKEKEKEQKDKEQKEKELKEKEREQKEKDSKVEKLKELKEREKDKPSEVKTRDLMKSRSVSKTRSLPPVKTESLVDKRTPKPRRTLLSRGDGPLASSSRASRRPHASTDSDSSGRASRCGLTKKMQSRRSQSANSASSGNTIASSNSSKRPRKRKITEPSSGNEPATRSLGSGPPIKAEVGDKLKVYYGPTQSESKVTYEAKVIEKTANGMLRVHYTGWNTRYDEWIKPQRIALNVSQHERTHSKKGIGGSRRSRSKRTEETPRTDTDSDSDSEVDVKRPPKKIDDKSESKSSLKVKDSKSSDSSSSSKSRKRPIRSVTTPPAVSPVKKPRPNIAHQGRDYDLNEIRSELKGLHTVKQEPEETKPEVKESPPPEPTEPPQQQEKQAEDVYEFKEPEPFEIELHDEKKKRTHRIFDDISPSKYTSTLSKSLSEEIAEDPLRPRPSMRSPSLSPFREFPREAPGHQTPEEDSKDDIYSMDDDSLQGEGSSGPIFEGFTPAKNQETYSKKRNVLKLRELIDDSPDSPADDEQSSEDEPETKRLATDSESSPHPAPSKESPKVTDKSNKTDKTKEEIDKPVEIKPSTPVKEILKPKVESPKMPKSPILTVFVRGDQDDDDNIDEEEEMPIITIKTSCIPLPSAMKVANIPLPSTEPKEENKIKLETLIEKTVEVNPSPDSPDQLEVPSSPLIDTEEEKSEPDSPVRLDILPDPGFLLHSEGPKIAEKLLEAINSAKRRSLSPPPKDDNPNPPKTPKVTKPIEKNSPPSVDVKTKLDIKPKPELTKNILTKDTNKFIAKTETKKDDIGESSNVIDSKLLCEAKKKSKDISPSRLHSPLTILGERRKSFIDLPLPMPNKNNKVLSDTIQKLSSQINQSVASIPLPPFPPPNHCDSSDSDDSDRRLIIDKIPLSDWSTINRASSLHAGKSAGEWSAGESLLMLEDACKNQRKHGANVVVAGSGVPRPGVAVAGGSGGGGEDESNISLLLCSETIPGSPAPEAEPPPAKPQQHKQLPAHSASAGGAGAGVAPPRARWGRLADTTPPTTPDSSLDMSPLRERRMSERDSPSDRKEDDDERQNDGSGTDGDKPMHGRSRMVSESSCAGAGGGAGRGRRRRRDTDDRRLSHTPLNYNFYVELDPSWDCQMRINILTSRLADLRKAYHSVKADLAAIDRRRKKLRRKEREAVKAAKAACS